MYIGKIETYRQFHKILLFNLRTFVQNMHLFMTRILYINCFKEAEGKPPYVSKVHLKKQIVAAGNVDQGPKRAAPSFLRWDSVYHPLSMTSVGYFLCTAM